MHLQHMVKLLEEMKEVSMLDEGQRQNRRKQVLARRKSSRLEEAARLINHQNWEEADALLHLLESLHPADADVQAVRNQLSDARIASQADEWEQLRRNAEELLAGSKYDEALQAVTKFLDRFPAHPDCQQLAVRIRHDLQAYNESVSSTMYDEIKAAVEARQWRTALDGIQRFLDRFPDHVRAAKIRNQVRVIQKNAEIEERHELEDRIRDLITSKQYTDAADMIEDLLRRFPDSPQTAYLTDLLPKLRERAGSETQEIAG
jgi:outer membrane protein assembly factor BamD (BamD/ComL family)